MGEVVDGLPGMVLLLGDNVRSTLARAAEKKDLTEIRNLLSDAESSMALLVQKAIAAQAEIDGNPDD
ncbi:MAG TPA: hypothetical protein VFT69_07815 [Pseudolabrys sp.]|nr:hypothetical protein [Pseudolabrys sp.]